jgi:hypothetical protein
MINISVTTLSSRKDSSKENLANSGELGEIQNHLAVWSVLDSEKWNQLTVWMEFGQCGLLPRQETLMGMESFGDCMDYWSFAIERAV